MIELRDQLPPRRVTEKRGSWRKRSATRWDSQDTTDGGDGGWMTTELGCPPCLTQHPLDDLAGPFSVAVPSISLESRSAELRANFLCRRRTETKGRLRKGVRPMTSEHSSTINGCWFSSSGRRQVMSRWKDCSRCLNRMNYGDAKVGIELHFWKWEGVCRAQNSRRNRQPLRVKNAYCADEGVRERSFVATGSRPPCYRGLLSTSTIASDA